MKAYPILLCGLSLALLASTAPPSAAEALRIESASGQFVVLPGESSRAIGTSAFLSESGLLRLDPSLLTVSAERLRQHLMRELANTAPWEGRVLFTLRATRSFEDPVEVLAEWLGARWQYHVSLPDYIARDRLVRALVEVNLLERAQRGGTDRAVEPPAWLVEGLTAHLLASRSLEIILPPPKLEWRGLTLTPWMVEEVHYQPLALAHAQLQTNTPLTIEQLSWPASGALKGRRGEAYQHCAQLLVTRLLALPDGAKLLNGFLENLGRHYNWQVAFLDVYRAHFPSLLAFEKWWALQVAHFTGRQLGATYEYQESVQRLRQAVQFPVEVRLETNTLPMRGDIRLQTILVEWEGRQQVAALKQTLSQLTLLRARIAPELVSLLDEYRLTLHYYLRNRDRTGIYLPKGVNRQASLVILIRRTVRTLDRLDAELETLLPRSTGNPDLAASPE